MIYNSFEDTGLLRVLQFLKAHDTEYLSGQDLSDVLHISRVAVWKHIKKIQNFSADISEKFFKPKIPDLLILGSIAELSIKMTGTSNFWKVSNNLACSSKFHITRSLLGRTL